MKGVIPTGALCLGVLAATLLAASCGGPAGTALPPAREVPEVRPPTPEERVEEEVLLELSREIAITGTRGKKGSRAVVAVSDPPAGILNLSLSNAPAPSSPVDYRATVYRRADRKKLAELQDDDGSDGTTTMAISYIIGQGETFAILISDVGGDDTDAEHPATVSVRVVADPDANEPNNGREAASALASDRPAIGFISYGGDEDDFKFFVEEGKVMKVELCRAAPNATPVDYDISITGADGAALVESFEKLGETGFVGSFTASAVGECYVTVSDRHGDKWDSEQPYRLTVSIAAPEIERPVVAVEPVEEAPAEEVVIEEAPAEEVVMEEVPTGEIILGEAPAEEVAVEVPAEEVVVEKGPDGEIIIGEAPAEEVAVEAPAEEVVVEEGPDGEIIIGEAPAEEVVIEEAPVEEVVVEEVPAGEIVIEEAPAREPLIEEAPVEEVVVEEVPAVEIVIEEAPAREALIEEAPVEEVAVEAPAEEAVVEEAPAGEVVVEEAPAEEIVIEEAPAEEVIVEEAPAREALIEEAPAEEAVVEEAPAEEAVIEEAPPKEGALEEIIIEEAPAERGGEETPDEPLADIDVFNVNETIAPETPGPADEKKGEKSKRKITEELLEELLPE